MNERRTLRNVFLALLLLIVVLVVYRVGFRGGEEEEGDQVATLVTVRAGTVQRATVHAYVGGYGTVVPEPAGSGRAAGSKVAPTVAGVVSAVLATEGQRVAAGDPLFQLDDRPIRAEVERARNSVGYARQALDREEVLREQGNSSERRYQDAVQQLADATAALHAAQDQLDLRLITAPVGGTVSHIYAGPGESVDPAAPVAEVVNLERLVLTAGIPAGEAGELEPGLPVEIAGTDDLPLPGMGSLVYVSPVVSPTDGAVQIRIRPPSGSTLSPGAVLPFRIVSGEHADRLVVPEASVVTDEDGRTVIARISNGIARLVDVVPGFHDGDLVEVAGEGLAVGDSVITEGAYALPSETRVRVMSSLDTLGSGPGIDGI